VEDKMINKFWDEIGSSLAERWVEYLFGSSFFFWIGGFIMYCTKFGYTNLLEKEKAMDNITRGALLISILILLIFTSLLMKELRFPIRRMLEGFWPKPFNQIAYAIIKIKKKKFEENRAKLRELLKKPNQKDSTSEDIQVQKNNELTSLEKWASVNPPKASDLLATRLGNILRAYEEAPDSRYGLSVSVVWTRLWMVLDDTTRTDITNAQNTLEKFCELWFFGLLFILWAFVNPWAIVISIVWQLIVYYVMILSAAESYGQLIESTFDLYRMKLYDALSWTKPTNTDDEISMGKKLTEYLWRSVLASPITYVTPPEKKD
jgi:hypothetical protein